MPYNRNLFSGGMFLLFTAMACQTAYKNVPEAWGQLETPSYATIVNGKWQPKFEDALGKSLPVATDSRNFWGSTEYAAFHDGRKGVVLGANGWLFTAEEFSCPTHARENLVENLGYIRTAADQIKARAKLAIVIVPAKARVYSAYAEHILPECRSGLYDQILSSLKDDEIPAPQLLSVMAAYDDLYFKTDTHWTPEGARYAARATADALRDMQLPFSSPFSSRAGDVKPHEGDLARYVPGAPIPADKFTSYATGLEVAATGKPQDLFDADAPPVHLVGTSYSANPDWNFAGFLKEALRADVLNMAAEAQGPLTVMDKYLAGDVWKLSPPQLVVWEIPERYMLMPHGIPAP